MSSLNSSNYTGVKLYVAVGPQYNFEFVDNEPCSAPLSNDVIQGTITGVPKMGSAMYMAFVGESMDVRWFGASVPPTEWGDGTGAYGWTHTYSSPGLYQVAIKDGSGNALAVRPCRVIYRTKPGSYSAFDVSYPVSIDPSTTGTIDTTFALKFSIKFSLADTADSLFGTLPERTLIGIYGEEYRNGSLYGNLKLLAGGWITNRLLTPSSSGTTATFTAYGVCYWLLNANMREMYFIDPGIPGADVAREAFIQGTAFDITTYLLAYNPNHWIKCQCTIAAMHVLQHLHVYTGVPGSPSNPAMVCPGGTNAYGTLGQFMNIDADIDVNEASGRTSAGYQGFSVSEGMVLSNIRSLIDNEGFRYYDRPDLTQRFERKPYYRTYQPDPTLQVTDATKLFDQPQIAPGGTKFVRQVIVERAPLATQSDATNVTPQGGGTRSGGTGDLSTGDIDTGVRMRAPGEVFYWTGPDGATYARGIWTDASSNGNFGGNNTILDSLQQSIDITKFYAKWPDPANSFGETIQCKTVYSLDPLEYAKGRYKEERATATATLPIGQVTDVSLGDTIELTYANTAYGINWTAKTFDVIADRLLILPGKFARMIDVVECDPDSTGTADYVPAGNYTTGTNPYAGLPTPDAPTSLAITSVVPSGTGIYTATLQFTPPANLGSFYNTGWLYQVYKNGSFYQWSNQHATIQVQYAAGSTDVNSWTVVMHAPNATSAQSNAVTTTGGSTP